MSAPHTRQIPSDNGGTIWAQRTSSGIWLHTTHRIPPGRIIEASGSGAELNMSLRLGHLAADELGRFMAQQTHKCYYADPSGGLGWPSCVICGAPVPTETAHRALRVCCQTDPEENHTPTCASLDAQRKRGQR